MGAYPTGCVGHYAADEAHLANYLDAAKAGNVDAYLARVVHGVRRHADLAEAAA